MQGYVIHPRDEKTRYSQTIESLQNILFLGTSRQITEEYYRLGETPQKINRQQYRDARQPKFYSGTDYPLLKTVKIENAIEAAQENKLSVIITDLYQASEDVNQINRRIEQNYLNVNNIEADYAVGIVAIKSEFNGEVYREDDSGSKFRYTTHNTQGNKIKEFRPFYLIFLGKYSDIAFYFNKISKENKIPTDSQLNIFSANHLIEEVSYLDGEAVPQKKSVQKIAAVGSPRIEVNEEKIHLFRVNANPDKEIPINYSVPLRLYSHTLLPFSNIETETTVQIFDNLEKKLLESNDSGLKQALQLNQWEKDGEGNLKFVTTIKPNRLQDSGFYYFTIDAKAKGVAAEKWWSEWSSSNNNSQDWKTFNLEPFLQGLQVSTNTLMAKSPPVIGRFCYGIEAK